MAVGQILRLPSRRYSAALSAILISSLSLPLVSAAPGTAQARYNRRVEQLGDIYRRTLRRMEDDHEKILKDIILNPYNHDPAQAILEEDASFDDEKKSLYANYRAELDEAYADYRAEEQAEQEEQSRERQEKEKQYWKDQEAKQAEQAKEQKEKQDKFWKDQHDRWAKEDSEKKGRADRAAADKAAEIQKIRDGMASKSQSGEVPHPGTNDVAGTTNSHFRAGRGGDGNGPDGDANVIPRMDTDSVINTVVAQAREDFTKRTGYSTDAPGETAANTIKEYVEQAKNNSESVSPIGKATAAGMGSVDRQITDLLSRPGYGDAKKFYDEAFNSPNNSHYSFDSKLGYRIYNDRDREHFFDREIYEEKEDAVKTHIASGKLTPGDIDFIADEVAANNKVAEQRRKADLEAKYEYERQHPKTREESERNEARLAAEQTEKELGIGPSSVIKVRLDALNPIQDVEKEEIRSAFRSFLPRE